MLEKTLESPLDCKEIQPVHPKGNQSWIFIGRTDVEAESPILWPPDAKNWLIGKDPDAGKVWRQAEKGTTGWDGWMASLTQWRWVWVNSGSWWWTGKPGMLQSMGSQSRTRLSNWTELSWTELMWVCMGGSVWMCVWVDVVWGYGSVSIWAWMSVCVCDFMCDCNYMWESVCDCVAECEGMSKCRSVCFEVYVKV